MAKAIRKNLEDMALPAVPKATLGLNIPVDFFMARGRGPEEEVATRARAAEESKRSGRLSLGGRSDAGLRAPTGRVPQAQGVGAEAVPGARVWGPSLSSAGMRPGSEGAREPGDRSRDWAGPRRNKGAAGPARARRRLFRGEALPLQRPSATAVIRAFQPQMWA